MEKTKYLRTDFSRLFKKYPLYLAIVGVAASFIFSLENYAFEKGMVNVNVMDTYMFAVEMSSKLIKLLVDSEVIVPVTGHGKGKYRFQ